jgi:anti-sigma B factor antagonist
VSAPEAFQPRVEFSVRQVWIGETAVLTVGGDLDMLTAGRLRDAIGAALASTPEALIVDLTNVDFFGAAGMSVLVIASEDAGGSTRFAVIAGLAASRLITIVGLNSTLPLYPSLGAAFDELSRQ